MHGKDFAISSKTKHPAPNTDDFGHAGCVVIPASELMKKADIAMYEAKHGGRDGYRLFETSMAV
jgi:GGDEF domain-containing protein